MRQLVQRSGCRKRGKHHGAGIAVTGHRAGSALCSVVGKSGEVKDRTHRLVPGFATPDVQFPVHVEVFEPAYAGKMLFFTANMTLDILHGSCWIQDRKLFLHFQNLIDLS